MDCQNYTYSKLDSSEAEGYQKTDETSDLKIHIDSEKPLIEQTKETYTVKTVKNIKKKKRVLSTLDIFISIFIVTPCVVGCWRGVWQLMDIYAVYFPTWESFFIGMVTHVVLALGQDVFHYVVVEKKKKHFIVKVFTLFLMKFYITVFNVVTNLTWRGGWSIFDRFTHVQLTASGNAKAEGSSNALWFTVVCMLILFCLKGLKNTISPPFSIALDSKDEVFLFRTTYMYKVIYISIFLTKKEAVLIPNNTSSIAIAEKLTSSQSAQIEYRPNQSPRPFGISTSGPIPQKFTPTTPVPAQATKKELTSYPQLAQYKNNYYPKNIQEIIGYMTKNRSYNPDENSSKEKERQQATNEAGLTETYNNSPGSFTTSDPFYLYKPTDPSEINLLATASFRFAPPVWKNFQKLNPQPTQQSNMQHVENFDVQESIKNFAKPFVVSLNIYPMENDYPSGVSRHGQKFLSHRVHSYYANRPQVDPRAKITSPGSKMTIYLNVFPESFLPLLSQEKNRHVESRSSKVKFV